METGEGGKMEEVAHQGEQNGGGGRGAVKEADYSGALKLLLTRASSTKNDEGSLVSTQHGKDKPE